MGVGDLKQFQQAPILHVWGLSFELRRHSLGDIQDEEEYDQFMNMIFISSSFTDEIQSHYDSSDADVLPPSSSEEEKIEKTRK